MVDVITFTNSNGLHMTIVNDPISRLTTTNGGTFRIHIRFLKDYERLPGFGIFVLDDSREFRDMTYREIVQLCHELPLADENYVQLRQRGAVTEEILMFEFVFVTNPIRIATRARIIGTDRSFSKWTQWWEAPTITKTRFCFEIPTEDCEVMDGKTFNYWLLGIDRITIRRNYQCIFCLDDHPISQFTFYQCGHGVCTPIHRSDYQTNQINDRCFVCKQAKGLPIRVRSRVAPCPIDCCPQRGNENDYFFSPCGCIITHTFKTNEDKAALVGQFCPYKYCRRIVEKVQMCYL